MRSDQKPSARYLPRGDRPTRHAEQREGEAHGSLASPFVRDPEYDKGVAPHRSEQNGERRSTDPIDLRSSTIIDLRSSSSEAIAPRSETAASEAVPNRLIVLSESASLPCDGVYVRHIKPLVDRVVAAFLLVLLSPLILVIALGLLVTLRRPILFRQIRVGRNGVPFVLWKFRTMRPDRRKTNLPTPVERRVCHKSANDPRHTRFGRALRCTRLDELPQLANVLKGDMSLVGPRPELAEIVARYEPWQHDRHLVRPGLTGLWQVSVVAEGLMHEHTDIDIEYIQAIALKTDLRILLRTPATLVFRRGS
jgi:lipopolysaccharide/colanic/teichoic acid biosynthesis glycosyltransferase